MLVNRRTAFFRLTSSRKAEDIEALRGGWVGTLVSDDFAVYRSWEHGRQSCLAHLLRAALGLAQSVDARIAACGRWGLGELLRLIRMSPAETRVGEWRGFAALLVYTASFRVGRGPLRAVLTGSSQPW